ncbi:ATP-dependent DNA helicase UvrD2 [Micropruina sonneratiae]|uniref:ATP-dependent DNA helicase UvrD2 n=1 Tax=Micropruina sonneratiae TaxID=2986940 RepID=UPI002226B3F6|nr:ATP-dependent DNA helicase UvrD2 [Micropruina sp. KQZ13P-5]MCW3157479.1 ATP-dependent DNA helicase UvrD2 [Micropruina sp. KQZ13P-5]
MPDSDALLAALDPEQREVASTFGVPVCVIAGAGTGKTRAITHRIAYGCATGAYDPAAVLAVTFTTRAAGELRGRLRGLGFPRVQARTFHSAALRQAQYFWPTAMGHELPRVSDARAAMMAEAAGRLLGHRAEPGTLRDLLTEVSWAKVSNVPPADYAELASGQGREVAAVDPAGVARIYARYEKVKADRGVIDFDDVLLCTVALLSDHDDVRAQVRRTYRHVVVDEYQDVSPLQQSLLELWLGEQRPDLCVVGDPAQTIHSFAGARASYLTGFARRHPDAAVIRLVRDYRSTQQVVDVANRVLHSRGRAEGVRLVAQGGSGPQPRYTQCATEADEAAHVATWLSGLITDGVPPGELAVLYRIHAQSPAYEAALSSAGVPFTLRSAEGFFARPEVRNAVIALRGQQQADTGGPLEAVRGVLAGQGWTTEPPTGQGQARERWESLAALVALAEQFVADRPHASLADLLTELDERARVEHAPAGAGVTLSTLHAAKGLEWEGVALVGAQEGTLPFSLAQSPEQVAEEQRLFYVGITRAKRHLSISWASSRNGGGGRRKPSRFLDGIRPDIGASQPARGSRKSRARAKPNCRVCGGALQPGAELKLGRHLDCPSSYDERTWELLREWRRQEAAAANLPAFCVFTDATLMAIAERRPADTGQLLGIAGVGRSKVDKYGDAVFAILGEESSVAPPG